MAENRINTRIMLKYDSYNNWQTKNPTLLDGELAIAYLASDHTHTDTTPDNGTHPVLFKVGPGAFNSLPWASALAADVYAWAKKENPDWTDFPALPIVVNDTEEGKFVTDVEYSENTVTIHRGVVDWSDIQNIPSLGTSDQIETLQNDVKAINEELDTHGDIVTHNASEFASADIDTGVHSVKLESGTNNGTVKLTVDDTATDNIAVTGLGSAAFTESSAYDPSGAASDVLGTSSDTADKNTVYGAKAAAAAAQADATTAKTKIEAFLGAVTPDGTSEMIDTLAEIQTELDNLNEAVDLVEEFALKADKAITVTGTDGLTGGGDLSENRTIGLSEATKASLAKADTALQEHQDISGKADKVASATADNFAGLDANGNLTDSGKKASDFATAEQGAKADSAVQPEDLHTIATTGSIYDLEEVGSAIGDKELNNDPVECLIFYCGTATKLV